MMQIVEFSSTTVADAAERLRLRRRRPVERADHRRDELLALDLGGRHLRRSLRCRGGRRQVGRRRRVVHGCRQRRRGQHGRLLLLEAHAQPPAAGVAHLHLDRAGVHHHVDDALDLLDPAIGGAAQGVANGALGGAACGPPSRAGPSHRPWWSSCGPPSWPSSLPTFFATFFTVFFAAALRVFLAAAFRVLPAEPAGRRATDRALAFLDTVFLTVGPERLAAMDQVFRCGLTGGDPPGGGAKQTALDNGLQRIPGGGAEVPAGDRPPRRAGARTPGPALRAAPRSARR